MGCVVRSTPQILSGLRWFSRGCARLGLSSRAFPRSPAERAANNRHPDRADTKPSCPHRARSDELQTPESFLAKNESPASNAARWCIGLAGRFVLAVPGPPLLVEHTYDVPALPHCQGRHDLQPSRFVCVGADPAK